MFQTPHRSWLIGLLAVVLGVPPLALPVSGLSTTAIRLTSEVEWRYNGGPMPSALLDGAISTLVNPTGERTVTISAPSATLCTVYFEFEEVPEPFEVVTSTQTQTVRLSFLHESVTFSEPVSSITLNLPEVAIVNLDVYSCGDLPDTVEQWKPAYQKADVLVVPTHFDDESLFFGGAITTLVNQGQRVQVAFLSHHNGQRVRKHEVLRALWVLGIDHYPDLGFFPDRYANDLEHAKALFDEDAVLAVQVGLIRRYRPEVVIGHDLNGEYGHGMHQLNAHTLVTAFSRAWDPQIDPASFALYGPHIPLKLYLHLYPRQHLLLPVRTPLAAFNGLSAFEVSEEAYKKHQSQSWTAFKVMTRSYGDIRAFGLRRSNIPVPSDDHFMAGVTAMNRRRVQQVLANFQLQ
jgi:LmbE family N-acetylglucosaminyl deacetylase